MQTARARVMTCPRAVRQTAVSDTLLSCGVHAESRSVTVRAAGGLESNAMQSKALRSARVTMPDDAIEVSNASLLGNVFATRAAMMDVLMTTRGVVKRDGNYQSLSWPACRQKVLEFGA